MIKDDLARMVIPGARTYLELRDGLSGGFGAADYHTMVDSFMDANGATLRGSIYQHLPEGERGKPNIWRDKVGRFVWKFGLDDQGVPSAILDDLEIQKVGAGQTGFGRAYMAHTERWLADHGVCRVYLQANISVGKYAWATLGYDYATPEARAGVMASFARWADEEGLTIPPADLARLGAGTARDLAEYDLGGKLAHASFGETVDGDYPIGKAFLLGPQLLSGWWGYKALDNVPRTP